MYSAENGHPTLTNPNVTYLQGVPDRFALGRSRWGHGYGLSQWGAFRRARVGHTYRQILGHYYSNIFIANGEDQTLNTGAILGAEPNQKITDNALSLRAMTTPNLTPRFIITASAGLTAPIQIEGNEIEWRAPMSLADGTSITATLWLDGQWQDEQTWQLDRTSPEAADTNMLQQFPTHIYEPVITITLPFTEATPLIGRDLRWQGENLSHTTNSGTIEKDDLAADGTAWIADPTIHDAGVWYGPYTTVLPAGHSYRAIFWMRTIVPTAAGMTNDASGGIVSPHVPLARLDVTDHEGRTQLGLRDLRFSDFVADNQYRPIAVDFHLFEDPHGLEFRVVWPGYAPLALDQVEVWQLPDHTAQESSDVGNAAFRWSINGGKRNGVFADSLYGSSQQSQSTLHACHDCYRPTTTKHR